MGVLMGHTWAQPNPGDEWIHASFSLTRRVDLGYTEPYKVCAYIQTQQDEELRFSIDEPLCVATIEGGRIKDGEVVSLEKLDDDGMPAIYLLEISSPGKPFTINLKPIAAYKETVQGADPKKAEPEAPVAAAPKEKAQKKDAPKKSAPKKSAAPKEKAKPKSELQSSPTPAKGEDEEIDMSIYN